MSKFKQQQRRGVGGGESANPQAPRRGDDDVRPRRERLGLRLHVHAADDHRLLPKQARPEACVSTHAAFLMTTGTQ